MPEINLLSTTKEQPKFSNAKASMSIKILSLLLLLTLAYFAYLWFAARQARADIATLNAKIAQKQSDVFSRKDRAELITRQGQLQNLNGLVKNHLYWSYLLPELARVTLKSSTYSTVTADSSGTLTMNVTAPTYEDLDKYLQIFNLPQFNQQFSDVKVLSLTRACLAAGAINP